ncbi:DNA-binding HxlR family transcriptional regulator [Geodermatophilus bullaregiensis]|jgi:DNA-binding HxlR family transcriptional regulator|uniref:winged helix-turn-helix transcriptional regulator n=1 Tax=Geodermatophilus bullaregiensis TaxID=1564160 RepID=UPI00195F1D96|nr:helix-turn-helix domain-containing protein [Geodermatophilus bullaregiensis]MBM7808201.1 DNA-binding HxlR family transcriptional regulator [Geodermatophilus bullaregiensis]
MTPVIHLAGRLRSRDAWSADACAMARALGVVSTKSAMLVLREAFYGATRFDEFVARTGASEPVVAARLRELVAERLLERVEYRNPGERTRKGYRLTEKGADVFPVLAALMQWGERWLGEQSSGVRLQHHGCGEPVAVELRCAAGHGVTSGELDLAVDRSSPRSPHAPNDPSSPARTDHR